MVVIGQTNTARGFAEVLRLLPLKFDSLRDPIAEDMRFPSMRPILRLLQAGSGIIPSQTKFTSAVIAAWPTPFPEQHRRGIVARIGRAYASLLREQHFGLMLREACLDLPVRVIESDELDLSHGIDFAVVGNGVRIAIPVMQATRRAYGFNERKHRNVEGWDIFPAELGYDNQVTVGDWWLFDPAWVARFVDEHIGRQSPNGDN